MKNEQLEMLHKIDAKTAETARTLIDYWNLYSGSGTWQFWVILVCLFILPLVVLYFFIDREKIFLLGFYGFGINVWFNFADNIGSQFDWWTRPYFAFPFNPTGFSVNAAIIPVIFLLVYQWTLNHNKNFYLFSLMAAMFLSFVLLPLQVALNFIVLKKGTNYLQLLLVYVGVFLLSKLIVSTFLYLQKNKRDKLSN